MTIHIVQVWKICVVSVCLSNCCIVLALLLVAMWDDWVDEVNQSGIFHLVVLDHVWPWVPETTEKEIMGWRWLL